MKKISPYLVNIFLVLISSVFFLAPIECSAVDTKANVIFTEVSSYEDEQLKYDLLVSENSTIAGITIEINYNLRQLKLVKCEVGEVLKPTISKVNSQIESKVILTAISTDAIKKEGAVLHLEFEVIDASKQYFDITCSIDECINPNCDELSTVVKSDKITNPLYISNETRGEISGESTGTKEPTEVKDEIPKTSEVIQKNAEKNDETSDENKPLQDETEVGEESSEPTNTSEKSHQDVEPTDDGALKKEKVTKSENNIILITVVIAIIGVTLLILTTWIRRKKK